MALGARFQRALGSVAVPTAMLAARRHRWARGERHAFDEEPVELDAETSELDRRLADLCRPDDAPVRVVHVDLGTNVFTGPDDVPVVLDVAPGARSAAYAAAVVVADALVWHRADLALVAAVDADPDQARALVARALRFRLVTDRLALAEGARPEAGDLVPYRRVVSRLA
jgi:cytochrome P450 monooxygenase